MAKLLWTIIENRKREWIARLDRLGKLLASGR
jgi:hypothetical protein